jgi:hypothetical protein
MQGHRFRVATTNGSKKRVLEKTASGENGQPGRFVHGQKMNVFVKNRERDRRFGFLPWGTVPDQALPLAEDRGRFGRLPAQQNPSRQDALSPLFGGGVRVALDQVVQYRLVSARRADELVIGESLVLLSHHDDRVVSPETFYTTTKEKAALTDRS